MNSNMYKCMHFQNCIYVYGNQPFGKVEGDKSNVYIITRNSKTSKKSRINDSMLNSITGEWNVPDQRTTIQISYLTTSDTFHSVSIIRFDRSRTRATHWLHLEEGKETGRREGKANYRHREIRTTL